MLSYNAMRPKRCLVDLDISLEIMKIFFWKMCNAKECTELKMSMFFKLGPYLENVAMK